MDTSLLPVLKSLEEKRGARGQRYPRTRVLFLRDLFEFLTHLQHRLYLQCSIYHINKKQHYVFPSDGIAKVYKIQLECQSILSNPIKRRLQVRTDVWMRNSRLFPKTIISFSKANLSNTRSIETIETPHFAIKFWI